MSTSNPSDNYVSFLQAKLATEVGPHETQEMVNAGKAILFDVRSQESHSKASIPGSLHIPRRELSPKISTLPRDKVIVAYCSDIGCQASLKATIELRGAGLDARHMVGGYKFWQEKGYPTTTSNATPLVAVNKN